MARRRDKPLYCTTDEPWEGWRSCRYREPREFDRRSLRTKKVSTKRLLVVGCPKGEWSPSKKRCKTGMRLQAVRTRVK